MKKLLTTLLIISGLCGFSQELQEIAPLSPETSSLTKFQETPVGYYTGIPSISIPLYTVSSGQIQVPISLGYHAGGIRVEEIASNIGLGWNLNVGGQISRVMRQMPDDGASVGYLFTENTVSDYILAPSGGPVLGDYPEGSKGQLFLDAKDGMIDYAPDEYYFSFMGVSGKFLFNQNRTVENPHGEIVMFPKKDIKVEPIFNEITRTIEEWIVTDGNGIKYYFGENGFTDEITSSISYSASEYDLPVPSRNSGTHYVTAWKLTKIKDVNNREVIFNYEAVPYSAVCSYTGEEYDTWSSNGGSSSRSKNSGINHTIKEILFDDGKVVFEKDNSPRLDLNYDKALKKIKVFDNSTEQILDIELIQDYFMSPPPPPIYGCDSAMDGEELRRRLYLKEVKFKKNPLATNYYNYKLGYNTETLLPHRLSKSQDYWGYYNGETNSTLVPKMFYKSDLNGGASITHFYHDGANRFVAPDYTQACMLKKITYPEGGVTKFIFENNEINSERNFRGKGNILRPGISHLIEIESKYDSYTQTGGKYTYSKNFTVSANIAIEGLATLESNSTRCDVTQEGNGYGENSLPLADCYIVYSIINTDTGSAIPYGYNVPMGVDKTVYLTPGNYKLELFIDVNNFDIVNEEVNVQLNWSDNVDEMFVGGLRIKEIKTYDLLDKFNPATFTPSLHKKYNYNSSVTNKSSGWIIGVPIFKEWRITPQSSGGGSGAHIKSQVLSSNNLRPLITTQSNSVGYEKVEETSVSGTTILKNTYKNSFFPVEYSFITAPTYYGWENGNLVESNVFLDKTTPGSEDLLLLKSSKTHYNYNTIVLDNESQKVINGVDIYLKEIDDYASAVGSNDGTEHVYVIKNGLVNTRTTESLENFYDTNNNLTGTLNTRSEYLYSKLIDQPITTTTTDSKGQVLKNKTYYPSDILDVNTLSNPTISTAEFGKIEQLKKENNHRITTPIQTETYKVNDDGSEDLLSRQRNLFKLENELIVPKVVQTAKSNNALEDRLVYLKYDSMGNPLEASKKQGVIIVYIWGHNKTKPIAKIENSSYNKIATALNMTEAQVLDLDESDMTVINSLRTILPTAMVNTYTYELLVGVTSMTDAKGYTSTYEYDEFNRLELVKDSQGRILSKNEYNYRTQN